ncbi:isoniazid inducible gene protein IniA [Lentzea sp. NBRC 105346]|uniref:dynamin family protein n=1 Tax=Lentzea sp. NBRC 105346 TaxID=3032205 RepID=UPI0024A037DD|nr:dynamin family protein [Lentzea sp. NBRC 105346]GLZ35419.1 isoniazid inducible gene protein IniA [Lentzea sp. NBRC 105346]
MSVSAAIEVVDVAFQAAVAYGRADFGDRLRQTRCRLTEDGVRVLVVGEFKQGKSHLVNALINASVCPVDDDIATCVPTVVRFAEEPSAMLVRTTTGEAPAEGKAVPVDRIADYVCDPANRQGASHAEVGVPRTLLAGGLILVDTPGVAGLASLHGAATLAALPLADAVVFVSDAGSEYTAAEIEFLTHAAQVCPNIVCALTKTDLHPHWRRIADLDRAHLADAGLDADVVPVSSTLRMHAVRTNDHMLNTESGFPVLIGHLRDRIGGEAGQLACRSAAHDVLTITEQLTATMRAQLSAYQGGGASDGLIRELECAQLRADRLRQRSSRWQQTLSDGIADLISDVEYDLRDRMRQIGRDAEREIDEADPAAVEDRFAAWLQQQVSGAASANFVWAMDRAQWLAGQVAEHFAEDGGKVLPDLSDIDFMTMTGSIDAIELPRDEKLKLGNKLLLGMRGGYGGTLMFGMAGTLVGMALLNPLSIAAGLLLGGRTVRDERKRLMQRKQMEAKSAVRRHLDDVIFQLGKESRDMLREVQRRLRDHFTTQAEELQRSVNDSLQAAQNALRTNEEESRRAILDLKAELERIAALEEMARELTSSRELVAR